MFSPEIMPANKYNKDIFNLQMNMNTILVSIYLSATELKASIVVMAGLIQFHCSLFSYFVFLKWRGNLICWFLAKMLSGWYFSLYPTLLLNGQIWMSKWSKNREKRRQKQRLPAIMGIFLEFTPDLLLHLCRKRAKTTIIKQWWL